MTDDDRFSDPERDRRIAATYRRGPRPMAAIDQALKGFLSSDDIAKMKRWAKVRGALDQVLGPALSSRCTPVRLTAGALVLAVSDGVLLSELRQIRERQLISALVAAGTVASRIIWQIAARKPASR